MVPVNRIMSASFSWDGRPMLWVASGGQMGEITHNGWLLLDRPLVFGSIQCCRVGVQAFLGRMAELFLVGMGYSDV